MTTDDYSNLDLEDLKEEAADLHADQQAMPDPKALQAHRKIVEAAYQLGLSHGMEQLPGGITTRAQQVLEKMALAHRHSLTAKIHIEDSLSKPCPLGVIRAADQVWEGSYPRRRKTEDELAEDRAKAADAAREARADLLALDYLVKNVRLP